MTHSLVVGGTRGIGREVVRLFSESGSCVSVLGKSAPSQAEKNLPETQYWQVDLTDAHGTHEALRAVMDRGKLHNLVFLQRYRGNADAWEGEMETSLGASKRVIETLSTAFEAPASIVFTSSVASNLIAHNQPLSYHVGKAGIEQLIRYYAVTLGPQGIRVNGVSPATTLKEESQEFYLNNPALYAVYEKMIPLRRMGTAREIAQVVGFLCSPQASFITGQTIVADGGLTLQFQETLVRGMLNL